jgi:glycosyltransferase involved in cell wall biosynthesis
MMTNSDTGSNGITKTNAPVSPRVSVIIPNYNHARFLRRRIECVLQQTFEDLEIILLDDYSTDGSREIISDYANDPRVRLKLNEQNSGNTFQQWNAGVRLARGEFIWIAESDDYADERFLERLLPVLEAERQLAFVYCRSWRVSEGDLLDGFADPAVLGDSPSRWETDHVTNGKDECRDFMIYCNTVPNASAAVFRRAIYEQVGGADEKLRLCGDWKLWAALALSGKVGYVAQPLNYYRFHENSVRSLSKAEGVWATEGDQVARWILSHIFHADYWVPLVLSSNTSLSEKRQLLRRAWAVDPHPIRNAIRPILLTFGLKFLREWRRLRTLLTELAAKNV